MEDKIESEIIEVKLPVRLFKSEGYYHLIPDEELADKIKIGIVTQTESLEESEKQFWNILFSHIDYLNERSKQLNKWKPFQKGDWSKTGGTWFIIYGIHFYFRYGENMQRGWYIPFTKINISISLSW